MSLIQCKYCGNLISEHAPICYRCGHSLSAGVETDDNYTVFSAPGQSGGAAPSGPVPPGMNASDAASASSGNVGASPYEGPRTAYGNSGSAYVNQEASYEEPGGIYNGPAQGSSFRLKMKTFTPYLVGFVVVIIIMLVIALLMKVI